MATLIEDTTITGLDLATTEALRDVYERHGSGTSQHFTREFVGRFIDVDEEPVITEQHIEEFNQQLLDGLRCQACGVHWTQSRLSVHPNVLCEDKCQ